MPDDPDIEPEPKTVATVRVTQRDLEPQVRQSLKFLRQVVRATLHAVGVNDSCEVSLMLTGDAAIQKLNADYRGKNEPTDVLSFALQEGFDMPTPPGMPRALGDIVISWDTTRRQAAQNGVDPQAELGWVLCHGVLHLLGYDHQNKAERARMRALEVEVLRHLSLEKAVTV